MRVFSYGGGVQSTAVLCLTAEGKLKYDAMLFANVGNDSEHPKTLQYMRDVARPFAEKHGIELLELQKRDKDGNKVTLLSKMLNTHTSTITIPVRMSNGSPGHRVCTVDFKIKVIEKWMRQAGATKKAPGTIGIGISLDEIGRMKTDSQTSWVVKEHPLIDLRLRRADCIKIIAAAGLPVPPKSACYFCPFHRLGEWQRMKREEPELFERSAEIESKLNERRARYGKDAVYLTRYNRPIKEVIDTSQESLAFSEYAELDICESGHCFT